MHYVSLDNYLPRSSTATGFFTWTWDGATWTARSGAGPPPRNGQVLVYDPLRHRVVMTGGWLGNRLFADVWEWDGAGWTLVTPA
jgi:hypothetical protein